MIAALLTTLFFSLSSVFAARSIRHVGATTANLGRLLVAVVCLGIFAHVAGGGLGGEGLGWFFLSGVIGMGLGDLAVFAALPRLGARLTVLLTQCVAVPVAMAAEGGWMGTRLAGNEVLWALVILAGVAVALMPSRSNPLKVRVTTLGLVMGVLAAVGQGLGAVVSRRAYEVTAAAGESIDGMTAAYQRIMGGLLVTVLFFVVREVVWRREAAGECRSLSDRLAGVWAKRAEWRWVVVNSLCGAVVGVSCYQWALATTPSGIVLPIVATTPLVIVPLAWWIEGERPSRRSLLGGVIAVGGVVALTMAR